MKIKFLAGVLSISSLLSFSCIKPNFAYAFEFRNNYYDMLDSSDLSTLKILFDSYDNTTIEGEYYKVGIMGHKRVVELGDFIGLKYVALTKQSFSVGTVSNLEIINSTSYNVTKTTAFTFSATVGHSSMVSNVLSTGIVGTAGTNGTSTIELGFSYQNMHSSTLVQSSTIKYTINLDNLIDGYNIFGVGEVALVACYEIDKIYTLEQGLFGKWYKIESTIVDKPGMEAHYYLDELTTFIYSNGFGDKVIGYYELGII